MRSRLTVRQQPLELCTLGSTPSSAALKIHTSSFNTGYQRSVILGFFILVSEMLLTYILHPLDIHDAYGIITDDLVVSIN